MENYESFLPKAPEKKKIPYDSEPILRGGRSAHTPSGGGGNKIFNYIVCALCVVTIVFSVLFGVLFNKAKNGKILSGNYPSTTYKPNQLVGNNKISDTAVNYALRSTVQIRIYDASSSDVFVGAGVIFNDETGYVYIATNYHVCYYQAAKDIADHIYILLCDYVNPQEDVNFYLDRRIECEFVGGSYTNDIAVIRFERTGADEEKYLASKAQPATIGDSSQLNFGDNIFAIGNPSGTGTNVTAGVISKINYIIPADVLSNDVRYPIRVFQIDAAINGGNSGGGLFDHNGNWVGIVNAKRTDVENSAYAIPGNVAYAIAWNIVSSPGKGLRTCSMGISYSTESYVVGKEGTDALEYKFKTIVAKVDVGSISFGKLYAGDVIKQISYMRRDKNDEMVTVEIDKPQELSEHIPFIFDGDTMKVTYERNGVEGTCTLTFRTPMQIA